jgi:very-short-patch-repair endonuclease
MDDAHGTDASQVTTSTSVTPAPRRRADFDRLLLELAGRQHYVVARDQLTDFGTPRQVEHRLATRRLERVHEGVYRVAGSPRSWHQQLLAACLSSSGANAVSFRAAAQMWGLPGGAEIVEVTAPRHRRMQPDGVTIHESRFLTDLDVTYLHRIPVTRPARVICDLALLVKRGELRASTLNLALQEAIRRDLVDLPRVWREWERLGGRLRPGGRVVEELLAHFVPPARQTDSRPESRLLQLLRAAQLPEPQPQHRVALSATRCAQLDFAWPEAKVYCEFDPYKFHGGRDKYMSDAARRLELADLGWYGVPVTDEELDSGARLATRLLRQHLPRAG